MLDMVGCDPRPGYPPDRTVRGDRRPPDPFWPAPAWPAETAVGRGIGVPGGGAGAAGRPQRALLAADVLRPAGPPVPVPSWYDPVPCGASRETVRRSELAGWAHYGYCAAHSRWYWGVKLYLITTPDGMPVAWCLADPKIGEREAAAELLACAARAGALRAGLTLIGDKGFAGRDFEKLVTTGYQLRLVRPDRRDEAPRRGSIGWIRQWIESVYDTLKGQLDLERHGGRTTEGLYARVAQRLLAMAACIWHNWTTGTGDKRSLIAYDH